MRMSRQEIHMRTALMWSKRSLCSQPNRAVGCVLTTFDMKQVVSIGYNGPAKHLPNNNCRGVSPCGCLHAEMNAMAMCSHRGRKIAFVTMEPCELCAQLLIQGDVCKVFYLDEYREHKGVELLKAAEVAVQRMTLVNFPEEIEDSRSFENMHLELWNKIDTGMLRLLSINTRGRQLVKSILDEYFKDALSRWTLKQRG